MLRIEGLTVRFGGLVALSAVDLAVEDGTVLGLIGPNGSGKTTLLNALSGVVPITAGRIAFHGREITGLAPHDIARRGIARTFQTARVFKTMTARDNIRPTLGGPGGKAGAAEADALLSRFALACRGDTLAGELTLAELRRLEVARALARAPRLLLLDEPTSGLSTTETAELVGLLKTAIPAATSVIVSEHKMDVIEGLCTRVALLVEGRVAAEAPPQDMLRDPIVQAAYLGPPLALRR